MSDSSAPAPKTCDELFAPLVSPPKNGRVIAVVLVLVSLAWLTTGLFVVSSDEVAVVKVCGSAERTSDGTLVLQSSGLRFHLPWPLTQIDRVRINEVRTLSVGAGEIDTLDAADFLSQLGPSRDGQFLSGDRNILNVQLNVQYRIARDRIGEWLYGSVAGEERLRLLSGAVLSDVVLRSGVDFVHTLGHAEIRRVALEQLRVTARENQLGVDIEDVTIGSVTPPIRVKAHFVDVMNARADRETYINRARAYSEQQQADGIAESEKRLDTAQSYARTTVDLARAEAESFNALIDQLMAASTQSSMSYTEVRQLALQREFLDTLETVYQNVAGKVFLDSGQPIDITIHRNPREN